MLVDLCILSLYKCAGRLKDGWLAKIPKTRALGVGEAGSSSYELATNELPRLARD